MDFEDVHKLIYVLCVRVTWAVRSNVKSHLKRNMVESGLCYNVI